MCVPATGLAQRLHRDARPWRGRLPARAVRRRGARPPAGTCPGTLVLETTWQTPTGWLIVRDALVMGPWHNVEERSKHPPPVAHRLRRRALPAAHHQVRLRHGRPADDAASRSSTTPARARVGVRRSGLRGGRRATAERPADAAPDHRPAERDRGRATARPDQDGEGDKHFVALAWSPLPAPTHLREAERVDGRTARVLAAVDHAGHVPRPPVALATCSAARWPSRD